MSSIFVQSPFSPSLLVPMRFCDPEKKRGKLVYAVLVAYALCVYRFLRTRIINSPINSKKLMVQKVACDDFTIVSSSDKKI